MPEVAKRSGKAILAVLLVAAVAVSSAGYRWVTGSLEPAIPGSGESMLVEIPSGVSTLEVAELLHERQLIKDPTVFRYYARYRQLDAAIQPGEYQLSAGMAPDEILTKLSRGDIVVRRFTVPEGMTVAEIAALLEQRGVVSQESFLKAAAASKLNEGYLPEGVELAQPLEGYLFPSTYDYSPGVTADAIIGMMFQAFERALSPALRERAKAMDLSVHQVLTLASIVEKEAQAAEERTVISGVYHNRLEIGMKLDADPTVRYALGKPPQEELLYVDLDVQSPYNTYRNAGLPPGPIAAPGKASIVAALSPEKHDFWYFVARADGTGRHYFAGTLDEQEENIAKARQNAKQ